MGQTVNPYEVAYFNGGADILDDIPVQSRDTTDQVVFRNNSNSKPTPAPQPSSLPYFTVGYNSYLNYTTLLLMMGNDISSAFHFTVI